MGILDSYLCFSAAICNEWSKQFYIYWLLGTSSYKLTYFGKFCYSKHKPYCLLAKVLGFLGSYCAHSLGNLCDNPSLSLLLLKQQSQIIRQKLFCSYLFEPFRTTAPSQSWFISCRSMMNVQYGNTGCVVFKQGVQN